MRTLYPVTDAKLLLVGAVQLILTFKLSIETVGELGLSGVDEATTESSEENNPHP